MKKIGTVLILLSTVAVLQTQAQTWYRLIEPSAFYTTQCKLTTAGNQFLISTNQLVVQLDQRGSVTGYIEGGGLPFWSDVLKKYDDQTGHPYFVISKRGFPPQHDFVMSIYKPGAGFTSEMTFSDSLGGINQPRPQVLEVSDNTFLVFGRKFYRQIRYSAADGFTEDWVRPLTMAPIAVLQHNGSFILADAGGRVQALDAAGNQLWEQNHPINIRALKATTGGFLVCGSNNSAQAMLMKLNTDGTEQWSESYSEAVFHDVISNSDGGYVVAGLNGDAQIVMAKLDPAGLVSWTREYSKGDPDGGAAVLELSDGGFLLVGIGEAALHCIRTDSDGQTSTAETGYVKHRQLKTAGVQSDFYASPTLFFDGDQSTLMPVDTSDATTLFACSPWIAGVDPGNAIRVAANDYFPSYPSTDYRTGSSETPSADFDRVWAVSRQEIQALRTDFLQDQNLQEHIPFDVLTWPGKGNPFFEYNLDFTPVSTDPLLLPAPFVDANNDGLYNVYDGDYPLIKGDQMAWWAITDSTLHTKSYGDPLVVDLQVSAYLYACTPNPVISQTLFVDFDLINRSGNTYSDAYFGFFTDPDLGCFMDDYIGTIPQVDSWYVYNEDNFDADCQGVPGFGSAIPVQSMSYLNVPLSHSIYYNNSAFGTPPPGTISPTLPLEYYRYLQGKWQDGTPLTIGGTGYNPFNMDVTNYAFHDNPADPQGWSLCTENLGFSDRRVVSSHGPFDLAPGGIFQVQLAFTLHADIPHPCPDIFNEVVPALEQLQQWHTDGALQLQPDLLPVYTLASGGQLMLDATVPNGTYNWSTSSSAPAITVTAPGNYAVTITGETGCTQVEQMLVQQATNIDEKPTLPNWDLWPNPTSTAVWIDCPDCGSGSLSAVIYNAQGQVVREIDQLPEQASLQVGKLPAGLYWVKLHNRKGTLGVKRMVVQR